MEEAKDIFDKISFATHMSKDEILSIAGSIHDEELTDRDAVRHLIDRLCRLTNRSLSSEQEEKLIDAIIEKRLPYDMQSLQHYMDD